MACLSASADPGKLLSEHKAVLAPGQCFLLRWGDLSGEFPSSLAWRMLGEVTADS